jgi:ankyrin repeat protein
MYIYIYIYIYTYSEKAAEKIDVSATLDDGSTYLHWAALANHGKMIDELMVIGFSPHTPTASGETPLFWAVKMGNIEAMEKIINGASMQYEAALHEQENKDEDHGDDDKDDEDDEDDKDDIDKDEVTETNNDINGNNTPVEFIDPIQHKDETGNSLLHIASLHNQEILAENLIEMGFSVNEKNFDGKTPLWLACDVKNYGLGQTLVNKFGADPKIPSNEGTSIDMDCLRAVDDKNEPIVVEENSN